MYSRFRINLKLAVGSLLLFAFCMGCAGVTVKDNLPSSSAKGYADFANYSYGYQIIYSVQEGEKAKEGLITDKGDVLRVARTPGNYVFVIEHHDDSGNANEKMVNVTIEQDMLTFVTIDNKIIKVKDYAAYRSTASLITYGILISQAETPAPLHLELVPNKTEVLQKLLKDTDWRARLYALGFLEKKGSASDPSVLQILNKLATDDPQRQVRKKAASVLKGVGIDAFKNILLLENYEANGGQWIKARGRLDFFYNDEYLFQSKEDECENVVIKSLPDLPRDFDIELVSTWKAGMAGKEFGIAIGSDQHNFDHFGISADGQAVVRAIRNDQNTPDLVAWTRSNAIKVSGTAPNNLKIEVRGDTWNYYVNDAYIGAVPNTMSINTYLIGLRICPRQAIAFEQFKISRCILPPVKMQ